MSEQATLAENAVVYRWSWQLRATPEQLWPYVSDTNRLNQLASMAPVRFTEEPLPEGGADRQGHAKMLGLGVTWDEHPFEWLYPQGFSVLREFHNGVLRAYRSSVVLAPEAGGTRLIHQVELVPRVALMAPFVRREGPKQERNWAHAYQAVDAYLMGEGPWPFANTTRVRLPGPARELAAELEVDAADPGLEGQLFTHVMTEHESEVWHVRPFVLADRWRLARESVLAACLYATRRKLLQAQWSLLCPHCRGAKGTAARPSQLATQVYCQSCNVMFGRASDDVVELTFRPDPAYRKVQEATFCVGGPGSTPHVLFQARLGPRSGRDVGLPVPPGAYRLRGARVKQPLDLVFHASDADAEEPPLFEVDDDGFRGAGQHLEGTRLRLRVVNDSDVPQDVVLETRDWRSDAVTLAYLRPLAAQDARFAALLD